MKTPLRVLVVAEGPSEIGDGDRFAAAGKRKGSHCEGYIPPLLRKMLGPELAVDAQRITAIGRFERPIQGHGDRAARALALAAAAGYALLVFVKDVDRAPGAKKSAHERKKKLRDMRAEIEAGFGAVRDAETTLRVKATPCRMIEAWALGDAAAIGAVGGRRANTTDVPGRPEEIWGNEEDPSSNHPKSALRRALGKDADARVFEELGREASPATLRRTCPESFLPFDDEMARAANAVGRGAKGNGR